MRSKTFGRGGVHPQENKFSSSAAIIKLNIPEIVSIPVTQHLGAPAEPLVKRGDKVKVGQLIAQSTGFISANIHSSVSGTVEKIDNIIDSSGYRKPAVIIKTDGDEWEEHIDRSDELKKNINLTTEEIIQKIKDSGIVGLGGATFPTSVKLSVPAGKKATHLLINGVECEPYLTSDHRLMLEKTEELLVGVTILMQALSVEQAYIGIEKNKPDAIEKLQQYAKNYTGIQVVPLKVMYPQGGEKQLIKAILNREVPSGKLPVDVGAVVFNVGTTFAVYEAVQKNKPLFERVVTITGKSIKQPSNFLVRIGTPISKLIEAAGGLPEDTGKIISGGPMMGKALNAIDVPVVKGTSGVVVIKKTEARRMHEVACVRCGKCISVCPMGLEPYLLALYAKNELYEKAEKERSMDCIECGCCQYTCPSGKPLLDRIRLNKNRIIHIKKTKAV